MPTTSKSEFPLTCQRCGAPRTMIDEGRAFFKCGADTNGSRCLTPRSVCGRCGKETQGEMQVWESRGGKIRIEVCPACDIEMTPVTLQ